MGEPFAGMLVANRYRLESRIGAGGFGETWRAHDGVLDLAVALKFIYEPDARRRSRCLHEARALARFRSDPAIVGVSDYLEHGEHVVLVLEYLDGQTLEETLGPNGRMPLDRALCLLRSVAGALERMHCEGMLHRDVSPDNIIVLPDGTAKLIDFGSVLSTSDGERRTVAVKPGYAPPEQHAGPSEQGSWTDVYALAATFYRCLTGRMPVDGLQRSFRDELPAPSALGAAMPATAETALMHALAPDHRLRTRSVGELMEGLGDTPERSAVSTTVPAPEMPEARRGKMSRPKPRVEMIILVVIAIVAVIAALAILGNQARDGVAVKESASDYTWKELSTLSELISQAEREEDAFAIEKKYHLVRGNGTIDPSMRIPIVMQDGAIASAQIIGFDHDTKSDGSGQAGITFMFTGAVVARSMNPSPTNSGGWRSCELRSWMNSELYSQLPSDLRDAIVPVEKATNNVGETMEASSVSDTSDKLWIPSHIELAGDLKPSFFNEGLGELAAVFNIEGSQYELFSEAKVDAYLGNSILVRATADTGTVCSWWERSPRPSKTTDFRCVGIDGHAFEEDAANAQHGVIPCFCL